MSEPQHFQHHKAHHPVHAYYLQPPLINEEAIHVSPPSSVRIAHKSVVTPPHSGIPTHYSYIHPHTKSVGSIKGTPSASSLLSLSSTLPSSSISPTLLESSVSIESEVQSPTQHSNEGAHLILLLAIFGTVGIISSAALIFCCCRKRKKTEAFKTLYNQPYHKHQQHATHHTRGGQQDQHTWASSSTINTMNTAVEGKPFFYDTEKQYQNHHHRSSSPFSTATTVRMSVNEKRLTADTLIGDSSSPSFMLIKKQYSPQLAFSPSLSADVMAGGGGVLIDDENQQPMDNNISPSNTLIDNAGVLSNLNNEDDLKSENYYYSENYNSNHNNKSDASPAQQQEEQQQQQQQDQQTRRKMYEPQVNFIQSTNDDNPFENTPYPLPNSQQQEKCPLDSHSLPLDAQSKQKDDGHETIQMEK